MSDTRMGMFNHLRLEMYQLYPTEHIWLNMSDGAKLDCYYITLGEPVIGPTIIYCNPNAGFCEFNLY